ncbi:MAG: class I SAM-dependent RNA methyltransferase [Candidatus Binatia bacterium]
MPSHAVRLRIERLSYGPAGVGRSGGKVIFVPGTAPGDDVDVVIDKEKKSYARGHVVSLLRASPNRREPPCPYVERCGGCPWQHLSYAAQIAEKENLVREQLRRIGGITDPPILPILPAQSEWHYRQRIRLHVDDHAHLGFVQPRSQTLVEIDACLIAGTENTEHLRVVKAWLSSLQTTLRAVEIVSSEAPRSARRIVLLADAVGAFQPGDELHCPQLLQTEPSVAGVLLRGEGWQRVWGEVSISCDLGVDALVLTVTQGTFTQVNPAGNRMLIATLLRLGAFHPSQRVVELYCGAGNLSLPLARRVRSLIGIEESRDAVADAKRNAVRAGIQNIRFVQASALVGVQNLLGRGTRSETIVLDPPRGGAAEVIDLLPRFGASQIVYVSCDPATLARDLRRLHGHGYRLQAVQPIDLFPQTYHVETIVRCVLT